MHSDVLTEEQRNLLPLIRSFSNEYYLVGGTAIALYIRHRRSIDFDLFTNSDIKRQSIRNLIEKSGFAVDNLLYEAFDQVHIVLNSVKITFFNFPYKIAHPMDFDGIIQMPTLLDLAAMKTYALGGRAKWKDYVDLYFVLKNHHDLKELSARATEIFGAYFNEKLFREQLCFFDDIDYSEKVEYIGDEVDEEEIRSFLVHIAANQFTD
ncbi:MAG: nucleotidyl transferase AbiEii/AbiGii toxin family protein [Deltaproteobacteria bacterium]|nr:nucleotidyl transferase AbiEii/AbiGii toxin family protein [Deltaproteobacteria bacterium]